MSGLQGARTIRTSQSDQQQRPLLILDLNGVLLHRDPDAESVALRPYCAEFLAFAEARFELAVWTCGPRDGAVGAARAAVRERARAALVRLRKGRRRASTAARRSPRTAALLRPRASGRSFLDSLERTLLLDNSAEKFEAERARSGLVDRRGGAGHGDAGEGRGPRPGQRRACGLLTAARGGRG